MANESQDDPAPHFNMEEALEETDQNVSLGEEADEQTPEQMEEEEEMNEEVEALFADQPNMDASELNAEVRSELNELQEEFGELSEILVDAVFNEHVAEFLIECEPVIQKFIDKRGGKARFYMHREPNDDLYLLLSPKPAQFKATWLQMQNPQPEVAVEAFERYADDILKTIMIKPSFGEVDWNLDGTGVNAPMGMTKSRIVDTFLSYEMNDPEEPTSSVFSEDEVDSAMEAAKRDKPSF